MKRLKFLLLLPLLLLSSCGEKQGKKGSFSDDFYQLMGKNTKHWSYVHQEEDIAFLEGCKALYEKNKELILSSKKSVKIPKIIHFIWLGPKPFPPESVENVRSWMAHHPDWTVKFWTDRERPTPCRGMQKVFVKDFVFSRLEHCYAKSQNYGEKSDILRYEILSQEGGIYVDHDASCLRPFQSLNASYDFYCGMETPHEAFVGRNITCGNGVLGARPNHPAVRRVMDLIAERWEQLAKKYQGKDSYSRTEVVMQRTYIALTHALKEGINKESNVDIVLPAAFFFAKSGLPSLYSKHYYATAWADMKEKKGAIEKMTQKAVEKVANKTRTVYSLVLILTLLNILVFGFIIYLLRKQVFKKNV